MIKKYAQLMVVYDPKENKQTSNYDYVAISKVPVYFVFS